MSTPVKLFYIIFMMGSGALTTLGTKDPYCGMAVVISMAAIGIVLDYLHFGVRENGKMLKQIHETLGIKEKEKK